MTHRIDTAVERAKLDALAGHTPGPWVRDCWDILGKGQGTGQVCEVTTPNGDDDMLWQPGECEGNVALIAAAPDLLTGYRAALDEIDRLTAALAEAEAHGASVAKMLGRIADAIDTSARGGGDE